MIQTHIGPVSLRRNRNLQKINLRVKGQQEKGNQQDKTISKDWLKSDEKHSREKHEWYRSAVMQSMLVAATHMELQDLYGRVATNPDTGMPWTNEQLAQREKNLKQKEQRMKDGKTPVPLRPINSSQQISKQGFLQKHYVMKRGSKTGVKKMQYFVIDNGKLKVFQSHTTIAKVKHVYELADVECKYEHAGMSGLAEPFFKDFKDRVRITLRERPQGPLYLYADDSRQARNWQRAIKMSKYLLSPTDKEALSFVVGRLSGSVLNKGWQALFTYAKEIKETRQLVKNLSMRLLRVDESRGWTKMRLVFLRKMEGDRVRGEQQDWAAKFLKDKLDRINTQAVRTPKMVRQGLIQQLQTKFRRYRQERIFDRIYPLGSSVLTRVQQAQSGTTMGSAFASMTRDDALNLVLNPASRNLLVKQPEIFHCKTSSYSEVNIPVSQLHVGVSESFSMLSFAEQDELAEHAHLAKEGWANFVNLDQISSVVMHSERKMNRKGSKYELQRSLSGGVWFSINGPRVCWCRCLRIHTDHQTRVVGKTVVGASNPFETGVALAKGARVKWLKVSVRIQGSNVPQLHVSPQGDMDFGTGIGGGPGGMQTSPSAAPQDRVTFVVLNLLGRTFRSEPGQGDSPIYAGRFEVDVPISSDDHALDFLDESEVGVDVVELQHVPRQPQQHHANATSIETGATMVSVERTIFAGKVPLWKLFSPEVVQYGTDGEEIVPLMKTLANGAGRNVKAITLSAPSANVNGGNPAVGGDPNGVNQFLLQGRIDLDVNARVQIAEDAGKCISPELQGKGQLTSLFTTHRGAWYDTKLGDSRFFANHVASFVELSIGGLIFPSADPPESSKLYRYQVVAKCNGVASSTVALHRAKETWKHVIPIDSGKVDFEQARLFLPLPPGVWCDESVRPQIEIQVLRCPQSEEKIRNYDDMISQNRKEGPSLAAFERVYHSILILDDMMIDEVKEGTRVALNRSTMPESRISLGTGECSSSGPVDQSAILIVDAALRDRDFVLLHAAGRAAQKGSTVPGNSSTATANALAGREGGVLGIGDKATIRVEEPLMYPKSELEFRRRFLPGNFDMNVANRDSASSLSAWLAPLRDPSLSHEFAESGLDKLRNPPTFKQRFIPTNCADIIPHKFVLPTNEFDFMRQGKPGVFWRIVDSLVEKNVRDNIGAPVNSLEPVVVQELSHLVRQVPCTVLAVYADGTCDVELAESFVAEWAQNKHRHYTLPGWVVIEEFKDESRAAMRNAPQGTGDVSQWLRMRVVLKGVALDLMQAVHQGSFNVYDARFGNVDEVMKEHPRLLSNDFDPRGPPDDDHAYLSSGRRGGYALRPGPLPADAGPSCVYEWSLHLHAESIEEMHQFVIGLRQAARLNIHKQLQTVSEWKKRSALSATAMPYEMGVMHTTSAGHLEVVLVEARHIRPTRVMKDKDTVTAMKKMMAAQPSTMASFQIEQDKRALTYRGSAKQWAPLVMGDNPAWSEVEEMKSSGGWVFKTPPVDPKTQKDLVFEVELLNKLKKPIGVARIDMTKFDGRGVGDGVNLCHTETPFHDFWVSVMTRDPDDPKSLIKDSANSVKVHLMTLWIPQCPSARMQRLPKKANDWKKWHLHHKMAAPTVREHLVGGAPVDIQVRKSGYNPNLWSDQWPPNRSTAMGMHIEKHESSLPYLMCCEDFCKHRFDKFKSDLTERGLAGHELSELREMWSRDQQAADHAHTLEEMLRRGIVPHERKAVWVDIACAGKTMKSYGLGGFTDQDDPQVQFQELERFRKTYMALVEEGRSQKNQATLQLSEDMISASAWETAQIPDAMDKHLVRINRAQNVCIALIVFSQDGITEEEAGKRINYASQANAGAMQGQPTGVAYCESLLVLAFHMLLAVGMENQSIKDPHAGTEALALETTQRREEEEEARVFWLLYTLSGSPFNSAFAEYYGVAPPNRGLPQIAERRGAMEDVNRLNACVARHERDLWIHLSGIGFHPSMVFYGAFMRLFATYLPTNTCFHLWDLLMLESAPPLVVRQASPHKIPRHSLIDLAFAVMQRCKAKLLKCQSSFEAKSSILDELENLYDPSEVVQLASTAEHVLWDDVKLHASEAMGIHSHLKDYERACALWDQFLIQFKLQNSVLREIARDSKLNMTASSFTKQMRSIRALFNNEQIDRGQFVGMHRALPSVIRRLGPSTNPTVMGSITDWFGRMTENMTMENLSAPIALSIPRTSEIQPGTNGEPTHMDAADFELQVGRVVGQDWGQYFQRIFQAFVSPVEKRLSANEFFLSVLCCLKGTVGEKAVALFNVFCGVQETHNMLHINTVTHAANTVVDKLEWNVKKAEGLVAKAPPPDQYSKHALIFKIYTHSMGSHDDLFGEVFVPTLRPYFWSGMDREIAIDHKIFSTERHLPPGVSMTGTNVVALLKQEGVRPEIGVMHMSIKWMPSSEQTPEVGQLGIRLHHIVFSNKFVEAHRFKNPRVEVFTHDEQGNEQKMKRWDPRSLARKGASVATDGIAYGGSFGEFLCFEETERRLPNGSLHKRMGSGESHGYYETLDPTTQEKQGKWKWSKKHGDQYSLEKQRMKKDFVAAAVARKPNAIPLRACRMITRLILSRSLHCVTNRQALQIADSVFNRTGAVPGIIDALLVRTDAITGDIRSASQLREALQSAGAVSVDVTHQVLLMHEESIDRVPGDISLFPTMVSVNYTLAGMAIEDPFPGVPKTLWVRYVRGGDGLRFNAPIPVTPDGSFRAQNLVLDMEADSPSGKNQMSVTKEEFVSCLMSSPLLSESLRQISTADNDVSGVVKDTKSIKLDVIIDDPNADLEDEEMLDVMNARQSICFELWDKDKLSRDDFLGECWLPPLSKLSEEPRAFVLPIRNAPETDDKSLSRPAGGKRGLQPGICTGNLFVEASWKLPAREVEDILDDDDMKTRVGKETALHTGELKLTIVKAEDLRSADVRRQAGSDPYVCAYIRNETIPEKNSPAVPGIGEGGWHTDPKTGVHQYIMRTSAKNSTVNPVWEESKTLSIQTGAFQRRTNRSYWSGVAGHMDVTGRSQKTRQDDHALDVLHGRQEGAGVGRSSRRDIRIFFGDCELKCLDLVATPKKTEGYRHEMKVLLSDSIYQFKVKLREACDREVNFINGLPQKSDSDLSSRASFAALSRGLSYRHVVMVFVPSQKLRELAQQQRESAREYRRLYRLEIQDPNSWQPLDMVRDFESYRLQYGFGGETTAQRLRVVEGTEDYKNKNAKYRQFVEEQKAWRSRIEFTNTESDCYGYARYKHAGDGDSAEWRPAIFERPEVSLGETAKKQYKAFLVHSAGVAPAGATSSPTGPGEAVKMQFSEGEVLLAPSHARINISDRLEHFEFLAKVPHLHEGGLTDAQIVAQLNKEMKAKQGNRSDYGYMESAGVAVPITVFDVQQALKLYQASLANGQQPAEARRPEPPSPAGERPGAPSSAKASPEPRAVANQGRK